MDAQFVEYFIGRWEKYFAGSELPICYYYTDQVNESDRAESKMEHRCLIGNLNRVRQGIAFVYDAKIPGCPGGKRYTGIIPVSRLNPSIRAACWGCSMSRPAPAC